MLKLWLKRVVIWGTISTLLLIFLFLTLILLGAFGPMPSKHKLEKITQETASLIYSADGEILGKFFTQNRTNIDIDSLPDYIKQQLVATEDERFYKHEGIDARSLIRVLLKTILLQDQSGGGGSTLTQQLAKNLFGRSSYGKFTIPVNKTKEIILAKRLEEVYSKDQILELYLNLVPFGENVYGIEAAAQRFFNKHAAELEIQESAVLIGMLKANTSYNPRLHPEASKTRRNVVLGQLLRNDYISQTEFDSISQLPLKIDYANKETIGIADYFLQQVKTEANYIIEQYNQKHLRDLNLETDGLIIETTLDSRLQEIAVESMNKHLKQMQKLLDAQYSKGQSKKDVIALAKAKLQRKKQEGRISNQTQYVSYEWDELKLNKGTVLDSLVSHFTQLQAGVLAIDPNSGATKVYLGGVDFRTQPFDQVYAKRQMASSFKPILYSAGIEDGTLPCDYLSNEPVSLSDFNDWSPENYDKQNQGGKYSMKAALSKSLNIPTLHLYFQVGHQKLENTWNSLGFSSTLPDQPSAALGTVDANIKEVATAYAAFANGGKLVKTHSISRIKTKDGEVIFEFESENFESVIKKQTAVYMRQMLEATINSGTSTAIKTRFGVKSDLAGKTGTSQGYADAWFCAFNPDLVWVSRVGCSLPSIHFNTGIYGSGSALALPIIGHTLASIQRNSELNSLYLNNFNHIEDFALNCPDFKEANLLDEVFNLFGKDNTTLEKERKKAEVKQGIRKGVRTIFGK